RGGSGPSTSPRRTRPARRAGPGAARRRARTVRARRGSRPWPWRSVRREGDRGHQRVLGLARIQARVLDHDRHVRLDHAGERSVLRDRLRILERVEAQVVRTPRRHGDGVRAGRLAVGEEHGDAYRGLGVAGVEDAAGLVAFQLRRGAVAPGRDVAFGDRPALASDRVHARSIAGPVRRRRHDAGKKKPRRGGASAGRARRYIWGYAVTGSTPAACAPFGPCWTS